MYGSEGMMVMKVASYLVPGSGSCLILPSNSGHATK